MAIIARHHRRDVVCCVRADTSCVFARGESRRHCGHDARCQQRGVVVDHRLQKRRHRHGARFEEASRQEYEGLARLLKSILARMDKALESPPYNLIVHSSPFSEDTTNYYHWHIEVMPKLTRTAGFEWGTGFYINPTSPEEATCVLRSVKL